MNPRLATAIAMGLLAFLGGCKKPAAPTPQAQQKEGRPSPPVDGIKVGFFTSLTGANATFGQDTQRGTELAVAEINKAGGILGKPITLLTRDTQSKPGETSTVVRELISRDGVVALLGEVASGRSLEAAPIAQRSGIPMISSASTNEKVTEAGDAIFRICFIDPFQGTVMAKFARSIGVRRAAILVDKSKDYSVGLAESFRRDFTSKGGEIVAEQSYQGGDKDFNSQLTAIKSANPEAIFLPSYYTEAPLVMRQAKQLGLDVPFMGTDGWDSPDLVTVGGAAVEGSYFSNHFSEESKNPEVVAFVQRYKDKYHAAPPALAALGYDTVYLLADAMKRANSSDPAAVKTALAATKGFEGVTGKITLDEKRNPTKPAVIIRVQDGKFTYLETVDP